MGGKSKKQTIGYKYSLGLHFAICYGPVDALKQIVCGGRSAWSGYVTDNETISIDAEDLFGGDKREGGIEGDADVLMGGPDQTANAYLDEHIDGPIPGFRGVLSLVYKGGQISANNPYVKPWAFQVQRVAAGWHGGEAWYPETASTGTISCGSPLALYIAMDCSSSMGDLASNGLTRLANLKIALNNALDHVADNLSEGALDIMVVAWNTGRSTILRRNVDAADIADIQAFVSSRVTNNNTNFVTAVQDADEFFAVVPEGTRRTVVFLTDGQPFVEEPGFDEAANAQEAAAILADIGGIETYGINIQLANTTYTAYLDNTPQDGIPVIDASDQEAIRDAILVGFTSYAGMNPAHIVYQCLTDPEWGMGYPIAQIDNDSFEEAADTFFAEGLGLCLLWNQQSSIEEFVQEVLNHAGAVYYADPKTGKFKLKALRADYDENYLEVFDETNIISLDNFQRPGYGDTINEITVIYRDQCTWQDTPITVQDLANIQAQGAVVSQTRHYPGIPNADLAARTAERDLVAVSTPLAKCRITVNRSGWQLTPGQVIKVNWDKHGLEAVIFRVLTINYGTLTNSQLVVELAEDVYGLPDSSYSKQETNGFVEPDRMPSAITIQDVAEVPYWDLARALTAADLSFLDADAAFIMGMAATSNRVSLGFDIYSRIGANEYLQGGSGTFAPTATVFGFLERSDTDIPYENGVFVDRVLVGQRALVGSGRTAEWVEIVSIDTTYSILGVNRGILDTTPQEHPSGTRIFFAEDDFAVDQTERATGESVDVKLVPFSSSGAMSIDSSVAMNIVPDQRLYRPYAPGRIRLNDEDFPEELFTDSNGLTVTWAHRDRLQQLVSYVSQDETSIGPEAGTTYNVRIFLDSDLVETQTGISGTSSTPYVFESESGLARVEVEAVRGGLLNWQMQVREFQLTAELDTDPYFANVEALLHFDGADGSTTVTDVTGRTWTVSAQAQIDTAQSEYGGSSLLLDGTGDSTQTAHDLALSVNGDYTFEASIRPTFTGVLKVIATKRPTSGSANEFTFVITTGNKLSVVAWGASAAVIINITGTINVQQNVWQKVAFTKSGSTWRIFLDGVLDGNANESAAYATGSNPFIIGRDPSAAGRDFAGHIDEVRITKGVARYTSTYTPANAPFPDL